jgi:hypothetical protein
MAVLKWPEMLLSSALSPMAVLSELVLLARRAVAPFAVLPLALLLKLGVVEVPETPKAK